MCCCCCRLVSCLVLFSHCASFSHFKLFIEHQRNADNILVRRPMFMYRNIFSALTQHMILLCTKYKLWTAFQKRRGKKWAHKSCLRKTLRGVSSAFEIATSRREFSCSHTSAASVEHNIWEHLLFYFHFADEDYKLFMWITRNGSSSPAKDL